MKKNLFAFFITITIVLIAILAQTTKPNEKVESELPLNVVQIISADHELENIVSVVNDLQVVTIDQVKSIGKNMSYEQILLRLGSTTDAGSGMHVAVYGLDTGGTFSISFSDITALCPYSGNELLELTFRNDRDQESEGAL